MAGLHVPLSTLRRRPRGRRRMTRGHRGSLLLRCRAFSSLSSCRFIPAHLLFHASARDGLTPPLHRTPPRQHAVSFLAEGLPDRQTFVPGVPSAPGFDVNILRFRCVSSGLHTFVFPSHTSPRSRRDFPYRSRPRLLTDAAYGGLGPPTARRPRRTYLHHWHSTVHLGDLLHRFHSPFRTHDGKPSLLKR
jgi:hypothetical protein